MIVYIEYNLATIPIVTKKIKQKNIHTTGKVFHIQAIEEIIFVYVRLKNRFIIDNIRVF
jgi:hypothetical protein